MNRYDPIISEFGSAEEEAAYDAWFRKKIAEAMADPRPATPHDEVRAEMREIVRRARQAPKR